MYFAVELQRRAAAAGLPLRSVIAVPGYAASNVLTGGANSGRGRLWRLFVRLVERLFAKPTEEGAWSSLYAATVPDLIGGSYIAPSGPLEFRGPPVSRDGHRSAHDARGARRLWALSEERTGVRFPLDRRRAA